MSENDENLLEAIRIAGLPIEKIDYKQLAIVQKFSDRRDQIAEILVCRLDNPTKRNKILALVYKPFILWPREGIFARFKIDCGQVYYNPEKDLRAEIRYAREVILKGKEN